MTMLSPIRQANGCMTRERLLNTDGYPGTNIYSMNEFEDYYMAIWGA